MPKSVKITFADGTDHTYEGVPDDVTPDQVERRAITEFGGKRVASLDRSDAPAPHVPKHFDREKFMAQEAADATARAAENTREFAGDTLKAGADTVLSMAPQVVLTPAAGIAGAVAAPFVGADAAADVVRKVQGFGYQPKSQAGQHTAEVVGDAMAQTERPGQYVADATGSPALGAAVTTGIQGAAAFLDPAVRGAFRSVGGSAASAARSAATPRPGPGPRVEPTIATGADAPNVTAAKAYAADTLKLDWADLSATARAQLSEIAKSAGSLEKMDPAAVARQIKFESLPVPVPATRGTLARDPVAMRQEGNAAATAAGAPIRTIQEAGNAALIQNLDVLKGKVSGTGKTAATATSPEQTGGAVQGAARGKLELAKAKVKELYTKADEAGETATPINDGGMLRVMEVVGDTVDQPHYSYVQSWLKSNAPKIDAGQITIRDIEKLRKQAVAKAMNGGEDGHYAGQLIKAIDEVTEGAGGDLYKAARSARRSQAMEFEEQAGVAELVDNSSRTDRATALEGTTRAISTGSLEDVRKVKTTLLTGGDAATRTAGKQAWREVRRRVIDDITAQATKGVGTLSDGTPNLTPGALKSAIDKFGPDKLNEIFGPGTANQLYKILDVARDAKTLPTSGGPSVGSSTVQNVLSLLGKGLDKIHLGTVTDVARGVGKVREIGADARAANASATTPLNEALGKAASRGKIGNPGALGATVPLSQIGASRR